MESREGTLDFFRRGSKTADINQLVAFFNAGVQSVDKFVRAHLEHPAATVAKATAAITIPSVLLYLVNRNDPTYKELPEWQKNLFWFIPVPGTNRFVFVPKPFIFGMLYGSLPERFLEYVDTKDKTALEGLAKSVMDSISPVSGDIEGAAIPTALTAMVENYANKDFFRGGRPIVSEGKERLLPEEQTTTYTGETAKAVGKALKVSPAKTEHLVQGLFGGTGRYALKGADWLVRTATGAGKEQPKNPPDISSFPAVGAFVSRPSYSASLASIERFYKNQKEIGQQDATYRKYLNEGRVAEAAALIQKHPALTYATDFNRVAMEFQDTHRTMNTIRQSKMPDDKKKAVLLKLQQEMTESAQRMNTLADMAGRTPHRSKADQILLKKYGLK
jgi:hypothetical protein